MRNTSIAACLNQSQRIVVKIGSGVLTEEQGLNTGVLKSLSRQVCRLIDLDREIILISSGAMAAGIKKIGIAQRPDEIPKRQAIAAVGQAGLMHEYETAFRRYGKKVGQMLLTGDGLWQRHRYLNARNTLYTLLSWGVVPIINENDSVSVDEIGLGDNDNLSAVIALLMGADVLINLTDIDGLFTGDPRRDERAELIPTVSRIDSDVERLASDIPGPLGKGGMVSKIHAAGKVMSAGIPMVIANGKRRDILLKLFAEKAVGTLFVPSKEKLSNRKCWIASQSKTMGRIKIDRGATDALLNRGKSLLPIGVLKVEGAFDPGAPVEFVDQNNRVIGIGLVNYSAADINRIKGLKSGQIKEVIGAKPYDEVIHRNNLAITGESRV
ncbi:MAG: glutamate 5-kinase [Myxococcota bacterium]|nr:glutamate 5-kinase [Myxococcota bacterium]